jgi:hypothetical protein
VNCSDSIKVDLNSRFHRPIPHSANASAGRCSTPPGPTVNQPTPPHDELDVAPRVAGRRASPIGRIDCFAAAGVFGYASPSPP